jgi:hypothetical protein
MIKVGNLTREHFERYPVWTWVEDWEQEDLVRPVVKTDPLPSDLGDLFIKADFRSATGLAFIGDVSFSVGNGVYNISFEARGRTFHFNVHAKGLAREYLAELLVALGDKDLRIFPMRYETKVRFAGEDFIAGEFDPLGD